ncbi:hypothetical protein KA005_52370 [bacterium]|nr:hypothetical protein [bacterium]
MIQENEIIMLLLGIGVLIFVLGNRQRLQRVPASKILISGFCTALIGWIFTVLEGFFWKDFLNFIEHICYAGSSVLVAFWCFKVFGSRKESR